MTHLAELVSRLWRAAQLCVWLARMSGWRSLWMWARVLFTASAALAWSLTWTGATVIWESA